MDAADAADAAGAERTYRYPLKARASFSAAALCGALLAAGALALQFAANVDLIERGQLLIFTAAFAGLAAHAASAARVLAGGVRLARTGLAAAGGELVTWPEIVRVEIRPLLQRMDVYTSAGRRLLTVRPELEAFAAVQDYVIAHMQPRPCAPPCTIPLLSPTSGAPLALGCVLLAAWFGPQRGWRVAGALVAIAMVIGLVHAARRRRLEVERDALVLRQGWRGVRVPYREISAVHLQARPRPSGGAVHYIVLERRAAESVPIAGFRGGYSDAYHCLEAAWRSSVHPGSAPG
jgi:hypothetical protein